MSIVNPFEFLHKIFLRIVGSDRGNPTQRFVHHGKDGRPCHTLEALEFPGARDKDLSHNNEITYQGRHHHKHKGESYDSCEDSTDHDEENHRKIEKSLRQQVIVRSNVCGKPIQYSTHSKTQQPQNQRENKNENTFAG
jgi:hypothetical protein